MRGPPVLPVDPGLELVWFSIAWRSGGGKYLYESKAANKMRRSSGSAKGSKSPAQVESPWGSAMLLCRQSSGDCQSVSDKRRTGGGQAIQHNLWSMYLLLATTYSYSYYLPTQ